MLPNKLIPRLERHVLLLREGMAGVKLADMTERLKKRDNRRLYKSS